MESVKKVAKEVIREMQPRDGVSGVDLDSYAYKDILREVSEEYQDVDMKLVDAEVRTQLQDKGIEGFCV